MNPWILVSCVVGATVLSDLLQSFEMKRHGEIEDLSPGGIGRVLVALARKKFLVLAVFFMAISFFSFMTLVSVADLSFAVPATALSMAVETILARVVLKEHIDKWRWAGAALVAAGVLLLAA